MNSYRAGDVPDNPPHGLPAGRRRAARPAADDPDGTETLIQHQQNLIRQQIRDMNHLKERVAAAEGVARNNVQTPQLAAAAMAREYELARIRAKVLDGPQAAADLAGRLAAAHRQAGSPPLSKLASKVGCCKGTLSKVFNNKMAPSWALVRKLGQHLRVPQVIVQQDWQPLWIAARDHRQTIKTAPAPATTPAPQTDTGTGPAPAALAGHSCPQCGSWVVDIAVHTGWHMQQTPSAPQPPGAEPMGTSWNADSPGITLLRQAFSADTR